MTGTGDGSNDTDGCSQFADLQGEEKGLKKDMLDFHPLLIHFAQAAFAPDGLPSLKTLIYGDFTFGFSYPDDHIILCRANPKREGQMLNFRKLLAEDADLQILLQQNIQALKACPVYGPFDDIGYFW